MNTIFQKLFLFTSRSLVVAVLFCGYNFTAFSQVTVEFETITEALNYAGDRDAVKKLIITGTISGDGYSATSEWNQFRTLDTTFPNLEDVEILTSQDIPDMDTRRFASLFMDSDEDGRSRGSKWLKNFSAPNIEGIGFAAFLGCSNLLSANFPQATRIEGNAFSGCVALLSVDFPLVTGMIEGSTFRRCDNLSSVDFPLVTGIGSGAFSFCYNLTSANFPLVTTIGSYAFEGCKKLSSINSPLVTTIRDYAFRSCESLLSADFPILTIIGNGAFQYCENLSSADFPLVTSIEDYTFEFCKISSADFPLVTTIGRYAFANCENLSLVNFPLVTTIGNGAFQHCENLLSANFPLVTSIEDYTFGSCKNLSSIDFPLVTNIGSGAFLDCENLTTIDFPMTYGIIENAFGGCSSLTSVSFGTGFTTPTTIYFYSGVFGTGDTLTKNIDLVLGGNVLPTPNLTAKIWQSDNGSLLSLPEMAYVWKSITIKTSGIKELVKNSVINIFPNPTSANFTISFELEKSCNVKIVLCDVLGQELAQVYNGFTSDGLFTRTHNTEHLPKGVYFLKILLDGNIVVEKIVVE